MRVIKIQRVFTDFDEAIKASKEEYGLGYYAKHVIDGKRQICKPKIGHLYVLDDQNEVWFVNRYNILIKFSWFSSLVGGLVSRVTVDYEQREIRIGDRCHDRETLRKAKDIIWTVD